MTKTTGSETHPRRWFRLEALFWAFFLFAVFLAGWFRGADPDWALLRSLRPNSRTFVLLANTRDGLPDSFVDRLSVTLGRPVRVEVITEFADFEARLIPLDSPPLVWLPASWAQALGSQRLLSEVVPLREAIAGAVSPDFLLDQEGRRRFIPVLWKVETQELRTLGLAMPHGGSERASALWLIQEWLREPLSIAQIREAAGFASALKSLDAADLPLEKRSLFLRNLDLRALKTR